MIVIDACVAVKWFLPEPLSDAAEALLNEETLRIAPEHILVEVGNVFLKACRSKSITMDHALQGVATLQNLVQLMPIHELAISALRIAETIACTNYDALYVAAAERWDAALVTADAKLVRQLTAAHWSGNYRLLGP